MQQGCLLSPLQRNPAQHVGLVHRQTRSSSRPGTWRPSGGSPPGVLGAACCPQRHRLQHSHFRSSSRLVPQTFLFDWVAKQTSRGAGAHNAAAPQGQHSNQHAAAQSRHHVDFSAAQAAIDETGSSSDGSTSTFGASAKQLLQTAVHSLENFEPRDTVSSFEDEAIESFEEAGLHTGHTSTAHIVKAFYEVLRLDETGAVRRLRIKRRDLLREHRLQPRDLRRIDPSIDFTKTSPSITLKEDVLLLNLGGVRAIVTADKALLFEPASNNTRKLLDTLVPRLQASAGQRLLVRQQQAGGGSGSQQGDLFRRDGGSGGPGARQAGSRAPPFELEVLEGVLMVATGRLDAEVLSVTRRVGELLQKLPRDINPVNLEELRRIKQALVELENKADMLREMLEQIMDDEDELREINLSSRPRREERRKQRERERMERQLTRAREEMEEQARRNKEQEGDARSGGSSSSSAASSTVGQPGSSGGGGSTAAVLTPGGSNGASNSSSSLWLQPPQTGLPSPPGRVSLGGLDGSSSSSSGGSSSSAAARQQRLAELYARHGLRRGPGGVLVPAPGRAGEAKPQREEWRLTSERDGVPRSERERDRDRERDDPEEEFQDAQDALEELAEQEEEEEELEEVEDLLEYYLQRSSATQSEAERLLEGARDLEESIGVSLSARRYEVNRLELMLSMGSFAAALGAMIAGIFGMNMRSTLEMSVGGFWGVTLSIVVGCFYIFLAIMRYTQKKRIL